jgi:hypothetical protein
MLPVGRSVQLSAAPIRRGQRGAAIGHALTVRDDQGPGLAAVGKILVVAHDGPASFSVYRSRSTITGHCPASSWPGRRRPSAPGSGLSFGLIHSRPRPFTDVHPDRVCAVRGRWRPPVNAGQHCWKACWGQPLASSNLASSAVSDQAIHKLRSYVRPGLTRLRSLICSLIHSTHTGIKRPKMQAHTSECYRDAAAHRTFQP